MCLQVVPSLAEKSIDLVYQIRATSLALVDPLFQVGITTCWVFQTKATSLVLVHRNEGIITLAMQFL